MIGLAWVVAGASAWLGVCAVSGQVLDAQGAPLAGARVFAEPGLAGAVHETRAGENGLFQFDDLDAGPVGVFAIAEGRGFGGKHLNLAVAEEVDGIKIVLTAADQISGRVMDHKGKPIAGARITRVGLLGDEKVGIPLAKMKALGFETPVSDEAGRFVVPNLPQGSSVALKVGHPDYAQEGVENLAVGKTDIAVTLYPGVVQEGLVLTKGGQSPVANAAVIIRNGQPPYDTVVTQSNGFGEFSIRLKPGMYLYQASSGESASPGWERLAVTGEPSPARLKVLLAGVGSIRGTVKDAVSGEPIAGARILADTNGNRAAIVYTGPTGEFQVRVAEGETLLRLESAAGFLPPETGAIRVAVAEGQNVELPGMWLAPAPRYRVQVLAADGATPVVGAVITVLRPRQFGWYLSDRDGWVEIAMANLPADGRVVGLAESLDKPLGALFALERGDAAGAKVQLLPLASVRGSVVDAKATPIEGAMVGAVFPGESADDDLLLWRCSTAKGGTFAWDAVIPGVPQVCVGRAGATADAQSEAFNLEPGASRTLAPLVIEAGTSAPTLLGKPLRWYENKSICGPVPEVKAAKKSPALVVYCPASQAAMVVAGMESVRKVSGPTGLQIAVVVAGTYACDRADILVLSGAAPGQATTYLLGTDGTVVLETFGLPPALTLARFQVDR